MDFGIVSVTGVAFLTFSVLAIALISVVGASKLIIMFC